MIKINRRYIECLSIYIYTNKSPKSVRWNLENDDEQVPESALQRGKSMSGTSTGLEWYPPQHSGGTWSVYIHDPKKDTLTKRLDFRHDLPIPP